MPRNDEWNLDEILGKTIPKQDQDWSIPEPKQVSVQVIDDNEIPQMDPAIAAMTKLYEDILHSYMFHGNPERSQFLRDDGNIGYKVHLNVSPEHVVAVSNFLKSQGFDHKYLSGGEISSGKIFTIYLGSKTATERSVKEIYDGIGQLLAPPLATGELEYAPRIVGRFCGESKFFRQYGREGISLLYPLHVDDPRNKPEDARAKAQALYGEYFGGGITPYRP